MHDLRDLGHRLVERRLIGGRRAGESADLADELKRCGPDFVVGDRRLEVVQWGGCYGTWGKAPDGEVDSEDGRIGRAPPPLPTLGLAGAAPTHFLPDIGVLAAGTRASTLPSPRSTAETFPSGARRKVTIEGSIHQLR